MNRRRTRPAGTGRSFEHAGNAGYMAAVSALYGTTKHAAPLPKDWRQRLPAPEQYYPLHLDKLGQPNASGWAKALCPFHDDHSPSLSVCLSGRGLWRCYAGDGCGHGDLVAFHMQRTGLPFKQAVRDLLGLRV